MFPTTDGYRFLSDCTADDLYAGAERRRRLADNLSRRAELYDSVAARIEADEVKTAGELTAPEGAAAVAAVRGPLRRLTELDLDEVARRLVADAHLRRLAVLADARGNLPERVAAALRVPQVAALWHATVQDMIARLCVPPPAPDTPRGADLQALYRVREALRASAPETGEAVRGRVRVMTNELAVLPEADLRASTAAPAEAGVDVVAASSAGAQGACRRGGRATRGTGSRSRTAAVHVAADRRGRGMAVRTRRARRGRHRDQRLNRYDDEAFRDLAARDVMGRHEPRLRHEWLVDRWCEQRSWTSSR